MRVSFHPDYHIGLPSPHPFPMGKYALLYAHLLRAGLVDPACVEEPIEAPLAMLSRVHASDYLDRCARGELSAKEIRVLGLPWSARLWRRSRLAVYGTYLAACNALKDSISANLAGGTHHAFADHGEGFCVLNDVAVTIRELQSRQAITRALIVDLDVHQGNGTAAIFAEDNSVFTLSIHGARNYPAVKARSSLDVNLPDGTADVPYLAALEDALTQAIQQAAADIVFYIAGVDVVVGDRYGRLGLTVDGLRQRDAYVIKAIRSAGLPLVIVLGGGYSPSTLQTAQLHAIVFEEAVASIIKHPEHFASQRSFYRGVF
jgi:acetoin utilization deacetylase AcuC-like enzyme